MEVPARQAPFLKRNRMKAKVSFLKIQDDAAVQVCGLTDQGKLTGKRPHRLSCYMLLWTVNGKGSHRVDYREYELMPGRLFFLHEGQVHQLLVPPEDGRMIRFQPALFREFLKMNPQQEHAGLFDLLNRSPFADINRETLKQFDCIARFLAAETMQAPYGRALMHYLSALLIKANQYSPAVGPRIVNRPQAEQLRRLKGLIGQHYKLHRETLYYSEQLGLPARKLNELCLKTTGKLVPELIHDRILSESELLLGGTNIPLKEIIYDLCFLNHTHFSVYFKKRKGMTPTEFRKRMWAGTDNGRKTGDLLF
jgi:AraC family transcriptional activator of pobA